MLNIKEQNVTIYTYVSVYYSHNLQAVTGVASLIHVKV